MVSQSSVDRRDTHDLLDGEHTSGCVPVAGVPEACCAAGVALPPDNDLRVELRTRNNVLWHAIFDTHESVAAFSRATGISRCSVDDFLNLRRSPYHEGVIGPTGKRLCAYFGLAPLDLFPPALYGGLFPISAVAEVPSAQFLPLVAAKRVALPPEQDAEHQFLLVDAIDRALSRLSPREALIVRRSFGIGDKPEETLGEIGELLSVSGGRIGQIRDRALWKLKYYMGANKHYVRASHE